MKKMVGLILLAVGVALLVIGWQASQSVGDQLAEAFTGRFTDETLLFLLGGLAAVIAGAFLTLSRK